MSIFVPFVEDTGKECHLEDFEGRKLKITLPLFAGGRWCIGITSGYLILFDDKTDECWLVNLITRHELYLSKVPSRVFCCPRFFRGVLVFSPSMSEWVFVVLDKCYHTLWVCEARKREWNYFSYTPRSTIRDLIAFKGKIYTLHDVPDGVRLCEMKLYPKPELVLLISNPQPNFRIPKFVSSIENLYVIDQALYYPYNIHELDLDEMKWVKCDKIGEKYAFFRNDFTYRNMTITLREAWADIHSQYGKYAVDDENMMYSASMWYFFDDCLNVNLIH